MKRHYIQIKLNLENSPEREALKTLRAWHLLGFSFSEIIVGALLAMAQTDSLERYLASLREAYGAGYYQSVVAAIERLNGLD